MAGSNNTSGQEPPRRRAVPGHPQTLPLNIKTDRSGPGSAARLTFQEGGALLDVGPQLLKDAIDLLLGGDKVLEGRSIHLRHVSLILLDGDNGVASREEQGHRAGREETVSEPGTRAGVTLVCGRGCRGAGPAGAHREHGLQDQGRARR